MVTQAIIELARNIAGSLIASLNLEFIGSTAIPSPHWHNASALAND
jgi:hypothetical protein